MMAKTLVWTQTAMEDGRAPKPPEFYVNAGDKMELYIVREESEAKQIIYAVNMRTKGHRAVYPDAKGKYRASMGERLIQADPDGWIEWNEEDGNPLPDHHPCDVMLFRKRVVKNVFAYDNPAWEGVTHYRPILDAEPESPCAGCEDTGVTAFGDACPVCTNPEPPAWDGEGLTPVGCECEVLAWSKWHRIIVTAIGDSMMLVKYIDSNGKPEGHVLKTAHFRPIRSEEDRVIEEMADVMREADGVVLTGRTQEGIARALHRAGYRKTGGEG